MVAALLGLAAAVGYGAADFVNGLLSRRADALSVALWSQAASVVLLVVAVVVLPVGGPSAAALGWGSVGGAALAVGFWLYFRGLARARMGVVASIAAVVAALLPVVISLALGERPSVLALTGMLVALVAIALVSLPAARSSRPESKAPAPPKPSLRAAVFRPGAAESVGAGVAFASFFISMGRTGSSHALWPLLAATAVSLVVLGAVTVASRQWWPATGLRWRTVALAGALGTAGSLAFLLATRQGLVSISAVFASLSPAVTVLLARLVIGERLAGHQLGGLSAAIIGVALMAAG